MTKKRKFDLGLNIALFSLLLAILTVVSGISIAFTRLAVTVEHNTEKVENTYLYAKETQVEVKELRMDILHCQFGREAKLISPIKVAGRK